MVLFIYFFKYQIYIGKREAILKIKRYKVEDIVIVHYQKYQKQPKLYFFKFLRYVIGKK